MITIFWLIEVIGSAYTDIIVKDETCLFIFFLKKFYIIAIIFLLFKNHMIGSTSFCIFFSYCVLFTKPKGKHFSNTGDINILEQLYFWTMWYICSLSFHVQNFLVVSLVVTSFQGLSLVWLIASLNVNI